MRMSGVNGARRIKITVGFLSERDLRNQSIQEIMKSRVGRCRQSIGGPFQDLVWVGIVEGKARDLPVRGRVSAQYFGCQVEIVHPSGLFALLKGERNGYEPVGFNPRCPENVV